MWLLKLLAAMFLLHTGQRLERGGVNRTREEVLVAGGDDMGGAAGIHGDPMDGDRSVESDDTGVDVTVTVGMATRVRVRRTWDGTPARNGDMLSSTAERVRGRDM